MEVFGSSGARGIAGTELTPEFVLTVAQAAGTVWEADRAAIATDTRLTGGMFADATASGLAGVGLDVDRLGITPTPTSTVLGSRQPRRSAATANRRRSRGSC